MTDEDREPVYWFCNSCGDEVDEFDECCDDGENEPGYDEAPTANEPTTTEPASRDAFNADYYAEHALDPDASGYLFGTAMGRSDS